MRFLKPTGIKILLTILLLLLVLFGQSLIKYNGMSLPGCLSCPDGTIRYGPCDMMRENWCAHWIIVLSTIVFRKVLLFSGIYFGVSLIEAVFAYFNRDR